MTPPRLAERETQERLTVWQESEPVKRAGAELGRRRLATSRITDWCIGTATPTPTPGTRSSAHTSTTNSKRPILHSHISGCATTSCIRPPRNRAQVTSFDELAPRIAVFEALVKAGRFAEASDTWAEFDDALVVNLGAYDRVSAWLGPLAFRGNLRVRGDLGLAYYFLGQYEEAISHDTVCSRIPSSVGMPVRRLFAWLGWQLACGLPVPSQRRTAAPNCERRLAP